MSSLKRFSSKCSQDSRQRRLRSIFPKKTKYENHKRTQNGPTRFLTKPTNLFKNRRAAGVATACAWSSDFHPVRIGTNRRVVGDDRRHRPAGERDRRRDRQCWQCLRCWGHHRFGWSLSRCHHERARNRTASATLELGQRSLDNCRRALRRLRLIGRFRSIVWRDCFRAPSEWRRPRGGRRCG